MYPRNSASPPPLAIGQVILIADGSVVTTAASARVKIGSGGWGAAAGTLDCDGTSGCWTYVPSQAETNAESFLVAVYKAACIGCQATVVTSASAVAGYGGLDWAKLNAPTTTVGLTNTTINDAQKVDVNTIKTKGVTVDGGGTTFPASIHASGAAVAKSPATLAAGDVTGNLPADVKAYTTQPTVTNATLSSAYDAAKTAASAAQVWSYATRTLTSLSGLVSSVAAAVWAYATRTLTQTAAQVADALEGEDLTIHRGDSYAATLTSLGNLSGRTALWMTVKRTPASDLDSQAKIQITETDGLLTLNGADYATPAHGSLTVNAEENAVTIALHGIATALLSVGQQWEYDLQVVDADGDPYTIAVGQVTVNADVTRATEAESSSSSPGP